MKLRSAGLAASTAALTLCTLVSSSASAYTPLDDVFIFFERGFEIDGRDEAILDNVVSAYRHNMARGILIWGYADRQGPADRNYPLSCRRALAVRDYLVRKGISADKLITRGFGESLPLVETPDGVSEIQNRRVELLFFFEPLEQDGRYFEPRPPSIVC
jgi:outer membrane protein OmpA-like peptidoglycan-associated protein